jgi:hypothetical protein
VIDPAFHVQHSCCLFTFTACLELVEVIIVLCKRWQLCCLFRGNALCSPSLTRPSAFVWPAACSDTRRRTPHWRLEELMCSRTSSVKDLKAASLQQQQASSRPCCRIELPGLRHTMREQGPGGAASIMFTSQMYVVGRQESTSTPSSSELLQLATQISAGLSGSSTRQ